MNAQERLERFRAHKDEYFKSAEHSPLLPEQQLAISGLDYFPYDASLDFTVESDDVKEIEVGDDHLRVAMQDGKATVFVEYDFIYKLVVDKERVSKSRAGSRAGFGAAAG